MKLLRSVAGRGLCEYKTDEKIGEGLNIYNLNEVIVDYWCRGTQGFLSISSTRIYSDGKMKRRSIKEEMDRPTYMEMEQPWMAVVHDDDSATL